MAATNNFHPSLFKLAYSFMLPAPACPSPRESGKSLPRETQTIRTFPAVHGGLISSKAFARANSPVKSLTRAKRPIPMKPLRTGLPLSLIPDKA
jgi:hypothetical protein